MKRVFVYVLFVIGALCSVSLTARAATAREMTYSQSTVWRCAVRFLRVDSGYRILEQDRDTGYLLFEYLDSGRAYNGSFEIMEVTKNGGRVVRVQLNVAGQPKYVENLLFTKLERKLKSEYGFPPAPQADPAATPAASGASKKADADDRADNPDDAEEAEPDADAEETRDPVEDY